MRPIGFSTGALAYADFRRGVALSKKGDCSAIELSALRQDELFPLLESLDTLALDAFSYVSIHAPSRFDRDWEGTCCNRLREELWRGWPIVLHPDAPSDLSRWRELGSHVCIENMDKRKATGRTVRELEQTFRELPDATFCFDIAHARQFDPTMTEAYLILREFGDKLRQIHISEVNTRSQHDPLSYSSIVAYREVAHLIPENIPLILESPVTQEEMEQEIAHVLEALPLVQAATANSYG
jgi:hypothetical protein